MEGSENPLDDGISDMEIDQNCFNFEYKDPKAELRLFLLQKIKEKYDLKETKRCVEKNWNKSLDVLEIAYIERKYIKYCSNLWLDDVYQLLTEAIKNKKDEDFLVSLDSIKYIKDVPKDLQISDYYKLLIANCKLMNELIEKTLIYKTRNIYLELTLKYNTIAKQELDFIDSLSNYLDSCKNMQHIISKLDLPNFICGKTSFHDILASIVDLENKSDFDLSILQEIAKNLQKEKDYTLLKKIKKSIGDIIKPAEIEEKVIDDRCIVEIKSRNLKISDVLNNIESLLKKKPEIVEIQFIITNNFYIEKDLKNDIWHGRNISILAKHIKVINKVSWDVSGKNSQHNYEAGAGSDDDGSGKDGSDGYPGESGGNVLILAKSITNAESFSIFSNGGNGSNGQNGGNGAHGANGEGISRTQFKERFPSVIKFACDTYERRKKLKEMIKYIKDLSDTIQCEWYTDPQEPGECDVYLEVTTRQGNQITFSYCRGGFTRRFQAFLLYKGSLGKPGKPGGRNGLGGEGGFAGSIEVKHIVNEQDFNVQKYMNDGDDGKRGKVGEYGEHGKNSWDMGYMDYQFWGETVTYDSSDNNINIVYYSENNSNRIWCPYKDDCNRNAFAEMEVQKVRHTQKTTYNNKKTEKENKDRQHFSRATKKKNVLKSNLYNYTHIIDLEEGNKLQDVKCQLKEVELRTLQAFAAQELQQNTLSKGLKINRISSYKYSTNKKRVPKLNRNFDVKKSTLKSENIETVLNLFINMPKKVTSVYQWLELKTIKLNIFQLNIIYKNWEKMVTKLNKSKNEDIPKVELMFVEKYRLAVLQEIAQKINTFKDNFENSDIMMGNKISATEAVKYLNVQKKKYSNIHHNVLGSLSQYIFDNKEKHREQIINFCKKDFFETHIEELEHIFAKFFSELIKTETDNNIKKYIDHYAAFLKERNEKIGTHYNIFKSELSKYRHKNILQLMLTNTIDKCLGAEVQNIIEQDPFLKILYARLNNQFQSTYDWSTCLQEKKVFDFFTDFVKQKGANCRCYRELLAYIFDVNIRVYCKNNKDYSVYDNHNSSSSNVIYLIMKDNFFNEIDINVESYRFYKKNKCLDNIYFNVLSDIYSLKTKKDLLEYLETYTIKQVKQNLQTDQIFKENFDEDSDIENIAMFFPNGEQQQIQTKLQKIKSEYIGHSGIIHILLKTLKNDGRSVSSNEMSSLINQVLDSCIQETKQENRICWILATALQNNWMAELLLIQLESYFVTCLGKKEEFRKYLGCLNSNVLATLGVKILQCKRDNVAMSLPYVEDTLYLLTNIGDLDINLEDIDLCEWLYVLKEYYWINKIEILFDWKQNQLGGIPYYILSLENMFGMKVVNEFLDNLAKKNMSKHEINVFNRILENFHDERWNLGREELDCLKTVRNILEWIEKLDAKFSASDTERNAVQLAKLIQGNSNTSLSILGNMPHVLNTLISISNINYLIDGKSVKSFTEKDIKNWAKKIKNDNNYVEILSNYFNMWLKGFRNDNDEQIKKGKDVQDQIFALIDRAIELRRGFQLRDTQKLTVMSLLFNNNSTLAQVSTGEGKSLIVVAVSIIKALCGEKVDVVTSSSVLAIRDAECNKDIYDLFNISVSHNCSENVEKRKESYSKSSVIYGDLSNFQRDYLLDRFYGQNILGDHDFSNIIVDEVDSMLLDKGNNMLYLSHDIAGLDKLESVYVYIWCTIHRSFQDITELSEAMNVTKLKEAVISDLYGIINKNDIGKLDMKLSEIQKTSIWKFLMKAKILNAQGRILINDLRNINYEVLPVEFLYLKDHIEYLLRECIERQRNINVPEYLKPFIERHLESWINSAIVAFFMKAGQDYVVDVDRTKTISDGSPIITIIDRDTGTDQTSSQWDEALHQFLQLKHGCKLTMQSLKAVFISNVSFFKLYRKLYGLTGTLGSQRERDLLKEVHNVDFVTVPTAKSKKFHEIVPVVCINKETWIESICDNIKTVVDKEKRSVLIICQLVDDVEFLQRNFIKRGIKNIHTYTRDYEEFAIARGSKKFEECQIIIATNLAGRGTDIILTDNLKKNGGLHVCLTYLPSNIRIERQAFGRAARCGDKGTGRLIIVDSSYQGGVTSKVLNLKKDRDTEELNRISTIASHYNNKIKMEETCFEEFKTLYEEIKNHFKGKKTSQDLQSILLQCVLDKWAFWLDENGKNDNSNNIMNKNIFYDSFHIFLGQLKKLLTDLPSSDEKLTAQNCFNWVKGNPVKMVILGKYFLKDNEFSNALFLFNEVIKKEDIFSEGAHYYKAFALSKQIDWTDLSKYKETRKTFKKELNLAATLFKTHGDRALYNATLIDKLKVNNSESLLQIKAYMEQQQTFSNFYNMYVKSIDDILGSAITSQAFTSVDVNETLAEEVFEELIIEGLLKKPKIKNKLQEFELKSISRDYGISSKQLFNFLTVYKGQDIDERKFIKAIKNEINLPRCEEFWKILKEQHVLFDEIKYVIIDMEKLKKVDPSYLELLTLKISSSKIQIPNFSSIQAGETNKKYIFFNGQCISEQKNEDNIILYKNELKSLDAAKFIFLKKRGVLSFNKMASINKNKIQSVKFAHFDSIVVEDFYRINVTLKQAVEILTELVAEGVLERQKINENQYIYKLKVAFEKITEIKLESRQVYKTSVIGLLFICFAYRIAIHKLEKCVVENQSPIRIQLMVKPHHHLVFELMDKKILKHVKLSITDKGKIEERLKGLFSNPMSKEKIIRILINSKLISRDRAEELFKHLVSVDWINHDNPLSQVIYGELYKIRSKDEILDHLKFIKSMKLNLKALFDLKPAFFINEMSSVTNPSKLFQLYNFPSDDTTEVELPADSSFKPIQKSLRNLLEYRFILGTENTIRILEKTLNQHKSSIKSFSVPDNNLKPFTDYFGSNKFLNVDELHIMCLNGLDHVQYFEEKKNTTRMRIYTAVVFGLAIIQIAFGIYIQYMSMGFMTHVGSMLISEGISDLLYATSAYKSGYFNLNDYLHHKVQSLIFSAVTVGVGAVLSRGVRYSRFGQKLLGPTFRETCGKELIDKVGKTVIVKSICVEALKGFGMCMANYAADTIIDRYLRSFCENIGSIILSNINDEVDGHNLSKGLENVFKIHGESKAKKVITELTDTFFSKNNMDTQLLPLALKISSSITKGISEAAVKTNNSSTGLQFTFINISKILVWTNRAKDIYMIKEVTTNLLDKLHLEIDKKLINGQDQEKKSSKTNEFSQDKYDNFKKEVTDNWKCILRQQAGQVIAQHIVRPILEDCLHKLIRLCGKKVKGAYRYIKESGLEAQQEELQKKFKKDVEEARKNVTQDSTATLEAITKKYHDDLLKLLEKTRSPTLFAAIVLENVPMDLTCFIASGPVIEAILKERGIIVPGLTIVVNAGNGVSQEILLGPKSTKKQVIELELKDNHYQLAGSDGLSNNSSAGGANDCLYQALVSVIPGLAEVGHDNFRTEMANCITQNPEIQNHIANGWHKYLIRLNLVGGYRKPSANYIDAESTETEVKDVDQHIVDRLLRLFRVVGSVQRISEETKLRRKTIIKGAKSQFHDKHSKNKKRQAGHVVRAAIDKSLNRDEHEESYEELKNLLGHTQIIPIFANEYHGFGGVMDKFQQDALQNLLSHDIHDIDFGSNSSTNEIIINSIKSEYINRIEKFLDSPKNKFKIDMSAIKSGLDRVSKISTDDVYEAGNHGYTGKFKDAYK